MNLHSLLLPCFNASIRVYSLRSSFFLVCKYLFHTLFLIILRPFFLDFFTIFFLMLYLLFSLLHKLLWLQPVRFLLRDTNLFTSRVNSPYFLLLDNSAWYLLYSYLLLFRRNINYVITSVSKVSVINIFFFLLTTLLQILENSSLYFNVSF